MALTQNRRPDEPMEEVVWLEEQFPLKNQLVEVEREIQMRERVYPRLVARGKLTRDEARYQADTMRAVAQTLRWLIEFDATIRRGAGKSVGAGSPAP